MIPDPGPMESLTRAHQRELLHTLAVFNRAGKALLRASRGEPQPLETLDLVETITAMVRVTAARLGPTECAALRPLLAQLAGVRDDLEAAARHAPADVDVDGLDDGAWTADVRP